jgi:hypothetical protein
MRFPDATVRSRFMIDSAREVMKCDPAPAVIMLAAQGELPRNAAGGIGAKQKHSRLCSSSSLWPSS